MSQTITCPVCETDNAPGAIHCEVCGERLAPAAPGETIPPEQNMAAELAAQASASAGQFAMEEDHDDLISSVALDMGAIAPVDSDDAARPIDQPDAAALPSSDPTPDVLYSHMTGEAFHAGSPEHEEGFGPMGEQLHSTPPAAQDGDTYEDPTQHDAPGYEIQPVDAPISWSDTEPASSPLAQTPQAPEPARSPFQASGPNPDVTLPQPGTHERPAELTLYFQKQPVLSYTIDTDEVLIGRKDIRADIDPDIDLTTWDHDAYVSRKHAYIYRQNKNYTLYAVSNGGLQLNNDLLDLGDRRQLSDGDVVVIAGILALKFTLPA